jgi:exodeoxyribonuclease VII small subunit
VVPTRNIDDPVSDDQRDAAALSFEDAMGRLEQVVRDLEDGDVELTEALGRYEEGVKLLRHCFTTLDSAQRRIEQLCAVDEDGNAVIAPFGDDDAGDESLETKANRRAARRTAGKKTPRKKSPPVDDIEDDPSTLF